MSNKVESLNTYLYQQTVILDSLPVSISIKDSELNYRYFNPLALSNAGFNHINDIYERSDFDMPWQDQASIFQHGGKKVLSGMKLLTLDPISDNYGGSVT